MKVKTKLKENTGGEEEDNQSENLIKRNNCKVDNETTNKCQIYIILYNIDLTEATAHPQKTVHDTYTRTHTHKTFFL